MTQATMNDEPPFYKGDKVRLKTGKSPIRIHKCCWRDKIPAQYAKQFKIYHWKSCWMVAYYYCSAENYPHFNSDEPMDIKWREAEDFVLLSEREKPMSKLYQTKEKKIRYGSFLTKDSHGRFVLEMKGSHEVEAFHVDDIEEVLPYTVELTQVMGQSTDGKGKSRHVIAKKDQVRKDDYMLELSSGLIWRVTLVDSKCRSASENKSKWLKLHTSPIEFGES